jgi:hypothetical protein
MRHLVTAMAFTALIGLPGLAGRVLAAPPDYDGNWTVLIVTEKGSCDRAYRYAVAVSNGRVNYSGERSVDMSGNVASNGDVRVGIRFRGQSANGSGRLSATTGAGSWHGTGSNGACAGRWEAERR